MKINEIGATIEESNKKLQDYLTAPIQLDEAMRKQMEERRALDIRNIKYKLLSSIFHTVESQSLGYSMHEDLGLRGLVSDIRQLVFEWLEQLNKEEGVGLDKEFERAENSVTISKDEYARLKELQFKYEGLDK